MQSEWALTACGAQLCMAKSFGEGVSCLLRNNAHSVALFYSCLSDLANLEKNVGEEIMSKLILKKYFVLLLVALSDLLKVHKNVKSYIIS